VDIEIEKLNFPAEEVLRFIESEHPIKIARNAFVSREYYHAHHPEGKHTPAKLANDGRGKGDHVPIVELSGVHYVALRCHADTKEVIKLSKSGRTSER